MVSFNCPLAISCRMKTTNDALRLIPFARKIQSQEVEETLKRIASHKGVVGTVVVNNEGNSNQMHFECWNISFGRIDDRRPIATPRAVAPAKNRLNFDALPWLFEVHMQN